MNHPSRRDLLKSAPLAALPFVAGRAFAQDAPAKSSYPGMTVRMQEPQNLEFPFNELKSWVTPSEQLFVRSHFAVPKIDLAKHKITVEGNVENKLELTVDEIKKMPAVTKPLLLECAGNGRVFLVPQGRGLQWGLGAVGNVEWTGIPLSAILERAKVKPGSVEVILVGADSGALNADPATPGVIHFDRSLPLEKAMKPEVMLAYKMNGEDLAAPHGAPLRAVIGGWYGMASVKWLTRIIVTNKPHRGYWQTFDYATFERDAAGLPSMKPITAIQPKSSIARPTNQEIIPAGKPYLLTGAAWTGESKISKVQVSTDSGATWVDAKLSTEDKPFCWRTWEYLWQVPMVRGPVKLLTRATDENGQTQPEKRDIDRRTYMINHLVPVEVIVR